MFRLPALADTLELLSNQPWRDVYDGPIRDRIISQFGPSSGGLLTADDLDAYAVVERSPLTVPSPRSTLLPPAPAAGGQMVGLM